MRRHLSIALREPAAEPLERLRQVWDPRMAEAVPAHVTLVYPEETLDETLLLERAESPGGQARWQATCRPFTSRSSGAVTRQRSCARWQRGWKEQPGGGAAGLGGSPLSTIR